MRIAINRFRYLCLCAFLFTACTTQAAPVVIFPPGALEPDNVAPVVENPVTPITSVPFQGGDPESVPMVDATPAYTTLWIDPATPPGLRNRLTIPEGIFPAESAESACLRLEPGQGEQKSHWIYALVTPFPTLIDDVTLNEVKQAWSGGNAGTYGKTPLMVSPSTLLAFSALWGAPSAEGVRIFEENELLDAAWQEDMAWALIPFENLTPRWKVLRVDGISPVEREFNDERYPLAVDFSLTGNSPECTSIAMPATNRDSEKMTVLVMTGVTALVRATGAKMEQLGMDYPAKDIGHWLREADLTHISNEVSFVSECPPANPYQTSLMFCSRPEYMALLQHIGADIIELTGNHLVDWRRNALVETLDLYREAGMKTYAAGVDLETARQPLLIEHNGNRLAFLGCNPAGPEMVWAEDDRAGAAPCDYEWMKMEISRLRAEGYLPVATLQYFESYSFIPTPGQQRDYPPLAEAGAVIVSGSQAHYPQGMTFVGDSFVHFGLGNLFFDQMYMPTPGTAMDEILPGTRKEFIDRHVFYDGKYISVELLTALLEDFAKPRPMTPEERSDMLRSAFETSIW